MKSILTILALVVSQAVSAAVLYVAELSGPEWIGATGTCVVENYSATHYKFTFELFNDDMGANSVWVGDSNWQAYTSSNPEMFIVPKSFWSLYNPLLGDSVHIGSNFNDNIAIEGVLHVPTPEPGQLLFVIPALALVMAAYRRQRVASLLCCIAVLSMGSLRAADADDVVTVQNENTTTEAIGRVEVHLTYVRATPGGDWVLRKVDAAKFRVVRKLNAAGAELSVKVIEQGQADITSLVVTNGAPVYPVTPYNGFVNTATGGYVRLQTDAAKGALQALKVRLGD